MTSRRQPSITQRIARPQLPRALSTLTLAYAANPVARWLWPDARDYRDAFPHFASAFGGGAIHSESAFEASDFGGVALWLPPGAQPHEVAIANLISSTVRTEAQPVFFALLEAMGKHQPHSAHWYLPLIGVDPIRQGSGVGLQLMETMLARTDRARLPVYLESTNARNLPFYERLGFEITARLQLADCPPLFPMVREPR